MRESLKSEHYTEITRITENHPDVFNKLTRGYIESSFFKGPHLNSWLWENDTCTILRTSPTLWWKKLSKGKTNAKRKDPAQAMIGLCSKTSLLSNLFGPLHNFQQAKIIHGVGVPRLALKFFQLY